MSVNNPLVSVIIPVKNREKTIGYCLDSVLAQSFSQFEVIVVDDGSTDATVERVCSINDSRIRLIKSSQSRGAQAARNVGIRAARANWVAFQDSDDEWLPQKLKQQIEVLNSRNWSERLLIHGDCQQFEPFSGKRSSFPLPLIEGLQVKEKLLASPGPMFQAMLVARSKLLKIGLLDEKVPSYQEWDTAIRLGDECEFVHLREPLFVYHLHSGPTISKNDGAALDGYDYVVNKHAQEIERRCGIQALQRHRQILAKMALNNKQWERARSYLKQLSKPLQRKDMLLLLMAYTHIRYSTAMRIKGLSTGKHPPAS